MLEAKMRFATATCLDIGDHFEIIYHFDNGNEMKHLRLSFKDGEEVPSIRALYACARFIESEIVDLFGVKISGVSAGLLLGSDSPVAPMRKSAPAKSEVN